MGFLGFVQNATSQAPVLLLACQSKDMINSISKSCNKNKQISKALLMAILPDLSMATFDGTKKEQEFVADVMQAIETS